MRAGGHLLAGWHVVRLVNLRHLLGRPRRTLLTAAGIAASVALVVAITVVNGTLRSAIDGTTRGLAGNASFEVAPTSAHALPPGSIASLQRVPGVQTAVPVIREITLLRNGDAVSRSFVFGVPANLSALFPDGLGDAGGQMAQPGFRQGLLVSGRLASSLGVQAGDSIAVRTAGGPVRVKIADVLGRNPFAAVNGGEFALLSLPQARRVFGRNGDASVIYFTERPGQSEEALRRSVRAEMGGAVALRAPGGGGSKAYKRTFDSIASVTEQARMVALLIALFLVFNTMSMSLAERREELVLLTLNGARQAGIVVAFVLEAAILGALGSAVGVVAGAGIGSVLVQRAADSYSILPFVTSGSAVVSPAAVALGLGTGIGVSIVGALLPAARILRVEPIDALRPEAAYEWGGKRIGHSVPLISMGLTLLACVAAIAAFAPLDAHPWLRGLALAVALGAAALLLPVVVPVLARALRRVWVSTFGLQGRLAGDTLLRNPVRTTIVAGALALSASVVISVGSGLGSYDREVTRASSMWYVAPLYVEAPGTALYTSDQPLPVSLRAGLQEVPGVRAAYPFRYGLVDDEGRQLIVYALSVAEAAAGGDQITRAVGVPQPRFVAAMRDGEIVMSRYAARRRGIEVGDSIELPKVAGGRELRVAGLFNDVAPLDSLYMEHADYSRYTSDALANRFAIAIDRGADPASVASSLRDYLRTKGVPASVKTRGQLRSGVLDSIESLFSLAKGVQLAALLIAGLIVLNTMLTATFERRREFGLERTIGMGRGQLAGSVMLESVAMSAIGGAVAVGLGLGLGFLMTLSIENELAWEIPFKPDVPITLGTFAATLVIGVLAALYPSWRASRQRLIELVGYE